MPKAAKKKAGETSLALQDFPPKVTAAMTALPILLRRFVYYYCGEARANGTLAAQLCGIRGGYMGQANWASVRLRRADVRVAIDAWMQAFGMTASEITRAQEDLAQVNMGPFTEVTKAGKLRLKEKFDRTEWEKHMHWVKTIRMDADGNIIDLEVYDRRDALKELAKINKMYSDAPSWHFHLYLSQLSDADLLRQIAEAREESSTQPRLVAGEPVAVIEAPVKQQDASNVASQGAPRRAKEHQPEPVDAPVAQQGESRPSQSTPAPPPAPPEEPGWGVRVIKSPTPRRRED